MRAPAIVAFTAVLLAGFQNPAPGPTPTPSPQPSPSPSASPTPSARPPAPDPATTLESSKGEAQPERHSDNSAVDTGDDQPPKP